MHGDRFGAQGIAAAGVFRVELAVGLVVTQPRGDHHHKTLAYQVTRQVFKPLAAQQAALFRHRPAVVHDDERKGAVTSRPEDGHGNVALGHLAVQVLRLDRNVLHLLAQVSGAHRLGRRLGPGRCTEHQGQDHPLRGAHR